MKKVTVHVSVIVLFAAIWLTVGSTRVAAQSSFTSNVILGTTDFVAGRVEQEIMDWFLRSTILDVCFKDKNNNIMAEGKVKRDDTYPIKIKTMFPSLCAMQKSFGRATSISIPTLLSAVRRDLELLPAKLLGNHSGQADQAVMLLISSFQRSRKGMPVREIPGRLAQNDVIIQECRNKRDIACSIYIASVFIQGSLEGVSPLVLSNTINTKLAGSDAGREFSTLLKQTQQIKAMMDGIEARVKQLEAIEKKIEKGDFKTQLIQYTQVGYSVLEIIQFIEEHVSKNVSDGKVFKKDFLKSDQFEIIKRTIRASTALAAEQYSEGLLELISLMDVLRPKGGQHLEKLLERLSASNSVRPFDEDEKATLKQYLENALQDNFLQNPEETIKNLLPEKMKALKTNLYRLKFNSEYFDSKVERYLPLFVDIASVKSADDFKKILETTTSPLGAWRLKRSRTYFVSFGALGGIHSGYEVLSRNREFKENDATKGSFVYGLFMPIGIDLSWTNWFWFKDRKGTDGLFLSFFDLGNLVNARFLGNDQGEVDNESNIGFEEVVSLGAYYRHGIGHTPWVWGLGASWNPNLRTDNSLNDGENEKGAFQFRFFIAIDVMMFHLSSSDGSTRIDQ